MWEFLSLYYMWSLRLPGMGWTSTLLYGWGDTGLWKFLFLSVLCPPCLHSTEHSCFYVVCPRLHHSHQLPGWDLSWNSRSCYLLWSKCEHSRSGTEMGIIVHVASPVLCLRSPNLTFYSIVFQVWLKPVSLILSLKCFLSLIIYLLKIIRKMWNKEEKKMTKIICDPTIFRDDLC